MFAMVYLVFGKRFYQRWQIFMQIFIAVNGQILKNNLAIWSHCSLPMHSRLLGRSESLLKLLGIVRRAKLKKKGQTF